MDPQWNLLLTTIQAHLTEKSPLLLAIDGPCCAGKSTLAQRLRGRFDCTVFHMDDFFLPPSIATAQRLAIPGGNVHWERVRDSILLPLTNGQRRITFRPYSCHSMTLSDPVTQSVTPLVVLEGSYSMHPQLRSYYDLTCFLTVSDAVQLQRLQQRDPDAVPTFQKRWIPLENRYFAACQVQQACDLVLSLQG